MKKEKPIVKSTDKIEPTAPTNKVAKKTIKQTKTVKRLTKQQLINGAPFQFKQVNGVFKICEYYDGFAIFGKVGKNFTYRESIKEIGEMGIELFGVSPIFETSFLHIQFVK